MPQGIGYQMAGTAAGRGIPRRRRPGIPPPRQAQYQQGPQWRRRRGEGRQRGGGGDRLAVGSNPGLPERPIVPPAPANQGLPLSPEYEAGQRSLSDQLTAQLAQITAARGQVQPMADLSLARMATNETEDLRQTDEDAIARGAFRSGIRTTNRGQVNQGYGRQRQDLSFGVAQQLADLANQESGAHLGYSQGLSDLLLQIANMQAGDPSLDIMGSAPYDQVFGGPPMGPGGPIVPRRRRGGGGGGGGGGYRSGGRRRR